MEEQTDKSSISQIFVERMESSSVGTISDGIIPNRDTEDKILNNDEKTFDEIKKRDKEADIKLKEIYGLGILIVLGLWELFVMMVVCIQLNPGNLEVNPYSDTVLIALLTSATANILALPAIILRYLFPNKGK